MLTHTQRRLVNVLLGSFENALVEPFLNLNAIKINPIFLVGECVFAKLDWIKNIQTKIRNPITA